jgi:competence protein ComFB
MFSGIENYYEKWVFRRILEIVTDGSEDYVEDVACVALNNLPTKYIRFPVDMASHMSLQEVADLDKQVSDAVVNAIALVNERRAERQAD